MAVHDNDAMNTAMAPAGATTLVKRPSPVARFLREVQIELVKTSWPSRDELTKFTAVVMITIVAVALYLAIADTAVGLLASKLFQIDNGSTGLRP